MLKNKYLIVVAHPDDEVLGAGGMIYNLSHNNNLFDIAILCTNVEARSNKTDDKRLKNNIESVKKRLGIKKIYSGTFPNIAMNTIPHLQLVQFIEKALLDSKPDIVITHHPSDVNNDHYQTSIACQAAVRLFQRQSNVKPINELWYMEIPSATDWNINPTIYGFKPNIFIEIKKAGIKQKIHALKMYSGVMREYPHPRSVENLSALATCRGAQSGLSYAEAFECVFRRLT